VLPKTTQRDRETPPPPPPSDLEISQQRLRHPATLAGVIEEFSR
jgi:hypothetical protein